MLLTIDTNDPRPIYQQVADGIKESIARGMLPEGALLPSVRQLAADLGVNLNTIASAYRELQEEGLIVVKHGSGSVVTSRTTTRRSAEDTASLLDADVRPNRCRDSIGGCDLLLGKIVALELADDRFLSGHHRESLILGRSRGERGTRLCRSWQRTAGDTHRLVIDA